jgi:hypothetical protein
MPREKQNDHVEHDAAHSAAATQRRPQRGPMLRALGAGVWGPQLAPLRNSHGHKLASGNVDIHHLS